MNGDGVIDKKDADLNPFSELQFVAGDEAAMLADLRKGRLDAVITIPADLGPQAADAKGARSRPPPRNSAKWTTWPT